MTIVMGGAVPVVALKLGPVSAVTTTLPAGVVVTDRPLPSDVLSEAEGCQGRRVGPAANRPTGVARGAGTAISVTVAPTALVRFNALNQVTAALTNTGCAPSPVDELWFVLADGRIVAGDAGQLRGVRWLGDFTEPGTYADQS